MKAELKTIVKVVFVTAISLAVSVNATAQPHVPKVRRQTSEP